MKCNSWLCVAVIITAMNVLETASALVIDDFTEGEVSLSDPLGSGSVADLQTGLDPAHTIGTGRHITFNAIDPFPFGDTGQVTVEVDSAGGGVLRHSPDTGLAAANFFVTYGDTDLGLPPMSLDLLADGADRFSFDFVFANQDPVNPQPIFGMDFLFRDGTNQWANAYFAIPVSNAPFSVEVTFEDILSSWPPFDLSDVTRLSFGTSNGTLEGSLELTMLRTVPEPASLTLAFLALGYSLVLSRVKSRHRRP